MGPCRGIGVAYTVRHHHEFAIIQRRARPIHRRQAHRRIGAHDPQGLDAPVVHRLEQVHRLKPRLTRHGWRSPVGLQQRPVRGIFNIHVGSKLIGQPPYFASTHGIGLAGERNRTHAGPPYAPGKQMAVNDTVDLVGAAGRLVDALGENRDGALVARK